ncbi:related to BRX1 - Essential nucleolar protein required for biogenesis of the 60S ribosomal subunit [Ustilago trichophora]|uniref:Related to BRX1 - Essential nucleolar protein required for biogenesis of the 60S ribosomal subunit n=1 Tax=Ustilago trichophora TaxID=86804 RepID=A0A5C3EAM1_9BASI|nr:related to BRX1 - Essential nucleolar protein required for biogenesis of the 60S ribosomal subunit [Ustilago trichophora]
MASVFQQASKAAKGKRKADAQDPDAAITAPIRRNKQRVLMLPSRGVTSRMRHLINDLESLMPHAKKDSKLDSKSQLHLLNELAELNNCNNALYFEARKREDLYLWASKTPNGPSAKFQEFDEKPHWTLIKEMFTQMFGVPKGARKSKPFVDHVISFSIVDNKVWFRNYQIVESDPGANAMSKVEETQDGKKKPTSKDTASRQPKLVEIGPRMVLSPIRVFEGSFGGATVFENPEYISPNAIRHMVRKQKGDKYADRVNQNETFRTKKDRFKPQEDALSRNKIFS